MTLHRQLPAALDWGLLALLGVMWGGSFLGETTITKGHTRSDAVRNPKVKEGLDLGSAWGRSWVGLGKFWGGSGCDFGAAREENKEQ